MADYATGTVLEDKEGDLWTVESDGMLRCSFDNCVRVTSSFVEHHFGPLKVVEEPVMREITPTYLDTHWDSLSDWEKELLKEDVEVKLGRFETKDSGERQVYSTGMQRDTSAGKARFDLLVPEGVPYKHQVLTRFAELMMRGAAKYDARNWEKAGTEEELNRFRESAFRHFMQWFCGEDDEDHMAAVMFNLMAYESTWAKTRSTCDCD